MQRALVLFAVFFAVLGIAVLYWHAAQNEVYLNLIEEGANVQGTVIEKTIETRRKSERRTMGSELDGYSVRYQFIPKGASKSQEATETISRRIYDSLRVGQSLTVTYWTGDPEIATIFELSYEEVGVLSLVGKILLGLSGAILGVLFLLRLAPKKRGNND